MRKRSSTSVRIFYPKFDKEGLIKLLSERLGELAARLPLVRVILFGSYVKGNYTAGSDVDLLIVHKGRPRDDAYAMVKKILNIPRLEPHVYTEEEYRRMEETLTKMTKDGITLFPLN